MIRLVPTYFDILSECLFTTPANMIISYANKKYLYLLPLVSSLFYIILWSNLLGLLPYSAAPTAELVLTLSMAIAFLGGVMVMGFYSKGLFLLSLFLPSGIPLAMLPIMTVLEVLSFITRSFSLGLRLGVNLITGHILAKVCVGFIYVGYENNIGILNLILPIFVLSLFLSLELLIAYLQAYIFVFIGCLTISDVDV